MARVDQAFLDFLAAQNHMEVFHRLDSDNVSDATINTIISNYKSDYEAWLKVYPPHKDGRGHVDPEKLAAAKKDPNFTNRDLDKIDEDHKNTTDPYSGVPQSWHEDPIVQDLVAAGIKLTPKCIAMQKIAYDRCQRRGYTQSESEKMSICYMGYRVAHEKILELQAKEKLSGAEEKELEKLLTVRDNSGEQGIETARSVPTEQLFITLKSYQKGKLSTAEARIKVDTLMQEIVATNRLGTLYKHMQRERNKNVYQQYFKDDTKALLLQSVITMPEVYQAIKTFTTDLETPAKSIAPQVQQAPVQSNQVPNMMLLKMREQRGGK